MTKTEILKELTKLRDIYPSQVRSWDSSDADKWWDTQVNLLLDQVREQTLDEVVKEVIGEDDKIKGYTRAGTPFDDCVRDHSYFRERNDLREQQREALTKLKGNK